MNDEEIHEKLRELVEENIPFNKSIGLKIESFDPNESKLRFEMRPELIGNLKRQILHGGVISATLDMAAGFALMLAQKDMIAKEGIISIDLATIDLHVDYLRPGVGNYFISTARIVRTGSRIAVVHMELHNDSHVLIATGGAAYAIG